MSKSIKFWNPLNILTTLKAMVIGLLLWIAWTFGFLIIAKIGMIGYVLFAVLFVTAMFAWGWLANKLWGWK